MERSDMAAAAFSRRDVSGSRYTTHARFPRREWTPGWPPPARRGRPPSRGRCWAGWGRLGRDGFCQRVGSPIALRSSLHQGPTHLALSERFRVASNARLNAARIHSAGFCSSRRAGFRRARAPGAGCCLVIPHRPRSRGQPAMSGLLARIDVHPVLPYTK